MTTPRWVVLACWVLLGACQPTTPPPPPAEAHDAPPATRVTPDTAKLVKSTPRLVILGFDGVDPRRLQSLMQRRRLPHIATLTQAGHNGPLATTNPPQSPVAWAAFATGQAAGAHGIFDFVGRDAATYMPFVATTRVEHAQVRGDVVTPAQATNLRHGDAFWDVIARQGVATRAITVPYAFPAPADGAQALAGLGTPDVRGTNSSFTLLTSDANRVLHETPAGGMLALLEPAGSDTWQASVEGPRLAVNGARKRLVARVTVHATGEGLRFEVGSDQQLAHLGETTPYMTLQFNAAPALQIAAATRFTVRRLRPTPEIYVEPLNILPSDPYLPLSNPGSLAASLWDQLGAFKTVGWLDDTAALGAGAIDEAQFLAEGNATMKWTERAVLAALQENKDTLLVAVFTTPDRIGHMFYRYVDPAHPLPRNPYADVLDHCYEQVDGIIGAVRAHLGPDDTLLVMSDHGFAAFRRGFNLNRWLVAHHYLTLKRGIKTPGDFFADVDWPHTRAYAFGTGGIYINLQGREGQGVVSRQDAPALAAKIAKELLSVRDGRNHVVVGTYLGDSLYAGSERDAAPDVRVAMIDGYRASWGTTLGGIGKTLFEDNVKHWSGDHASARPEDVPGILLANRPIAVAVPRIEDLAATAYAFTKVSPPAGVIGRPLLKETSEHATR